MNSSNANHSKLSLPQAILTGHDNGALVAILVVVFLLGFRSVSQSITPRYSQSLKSARSTRSRLLVLENLTEIDDENRAEMFRLATVGPKSVRQAVFDAVLRLKLDLDISLLRSLDLDSKEKPHAVFFQNVSADTVKVWIESLNPLRLNDEEFEAFKLILRNHRRSRLVGTTLVSVYRRSLLKHSTEKERRRSLSHLKDFYRPALGSLLRLYQVIPETIWRSSVLDLCANDFSEPMLAFLRRELKSAKLPASMTRRVLTISLENGPESEQIIALKQAVESKSRMRWFKKSGLPDECVNLAMSRCRSMVAGLTPDSSAQTLLPALRLCTLVNRSPRGMALLDTKTAQAWVSQLQVVATSIDDKTWRRCAFVIGDAIASLDRNLRTQGWIQSPTPRLRFLSILPLENAATTEAKELLTTLCADSNPRIQLQAAAALTRTGDPRGLRALAKLTRSKAKLIAEAASICIDFVVGRETSHDVDKFVAFHLKMNKTLPRISRDAPNAPHPGKFVP